MNQPEREVAGPRTRKQLGAWYTPPELVNAIVHEAVFDGAVSVLDPACGDGRFLRATGLPEQVGVDLDPATTAVLRAHRKRQREERLMIGPNWLDTGLVFTMVDGRGWHPDVISRAFARLVERSDLPRIRLHDLRHTHATHLLAANVNVRVVSERLGHASTAFTLDVYGHVLPGQQADAAAAVAALVDQ